MTLSEADTRAKLITAALHQRGWDEENIRREISPGAIYLAADDRARRGKTRADCQFF